jgi:acyl-CoA synthetase (AMP-forming)/AMP-acid ligase II
MANSIQDLIRNVATSPPSAAVIEGPEIYTYRDIEILATRVADNLSNERIEKGDRICLAFPNSVAFIYSFLGVLKAGAIPVPLSVSTPPHKLAYIVNDVGAVGYLGEERLISQLNHSQIPTISFVSSDRMSICDLAHEGSSSFRKLEKRGEREVKSILPTADDTSVIIYTSGTTGRPKGVRLSLENLTSATDFMIRFLRLHPRDRSLISINFAHCAGLLHLLAQLRCGGSVIVGQNMVLAGSLLKSVKTWAVTGLPAVPSMIALLLKKYEKEFIECCSKLRFIEFSSAPYNSQLIRELFLCLPQTQLFNTYGLTEAPRITYQDLSLDPNAMMSVGNVNPMMTVEIIDNEGRLCGDGEEGELFVTGPTVALGYWNRPKEEERRFTPNGYSTGDMGYRDTQGRLYLLGRRDEMLKSGAERIYPIEIEDVIHSVEGVDEVVVYGTDDDLYGQIIKAKIVASTDQVNERDIIQFCRKHLERHKVPRLIEICASLPRTEAGKIDRRELE